MESAGTGPGTSGSGSAGAGGSSAVCGWTGAGEDVSGREGAGWVTGWAGMRADVSVCRQVGGSRSPLPPRAASTLVSACAKDHEAVVVTWKNLSSCDLLDSDVPLVCSPPPWGLASPPQHTRAHSRPHTFSSCTQNRKRPQPRRHSALDIPTRGVRAEASHKANRIRRRHRSSARRGTALRAVEARPAGHTPRGSQPCTGEARRGVAWSVHGVFVTPL